MDRGVHPDPYDLVLLDLRARVAEIDRLIGALEAMRAQKLAPSKEAEWGPDVGKEVVP